MPPDDRTRDITLPPLPGRPPPALPDEWKGLGPLSAEQDPAVVRARRMATGPTDEMAAPPRAVPRERTLAFSSPEMRHRSIEPVQVRSNPRRWPWVLLTLFPILVIVGFGVAWLVLFSRM
ncbi:hypothetical protein SAMN05660748_4168 [Blastococcus aggregatus]|uniref:Uncharacterized protein n=2 Tax=Blastococcus aggregatus TaxID=38502 RepID=A0A285VFB6_9ACTN|nr:hypothetical protein SAMN05660748_4168 [Blastococcus aggregatus]